MDARAAACVDNNNNVKGDKLEELVLWLLGHLRGFTVMSRDQYSEDGSQEIDLVVYNDVGNSAIAALGPRILVECKNWGRNVGSPEVAWLYWKMRLGNADSAILVTVKGLTGASSYRNGTAVLLRANADEKPIFVVTLPELKALSSTDDLKSLLVAKFMGLTGQQDPAKT